MRKRILLLMLLGICVIASAQVPYYGATIGKHHLFGYHSVKFRPNVNSLCTYTTFQYGIGDCFSIGTDLATSPAERNVGYYARVGKTFSKWFSAGVQIVPSFDLEKSHQFTYNTTGLFLNGNITGNGKLFWVSNTWHTANRGMGNTMEQWWYLAGNFPLTKNSSIWPHVGFIHSWKFNQEADLAAGFFYVYKQYSFYLWGNNFFNEHPRLTLAVDFTF